MDTNPVLPPVPKRGGMGKWLGIGCVVVIVILIIGSILAYAFVKMLVTGLVNQYTDTQPRNLPQLVISEAQGRAICARVDAFQAALQAGQPAEPLVLTANDINALIQYHPKWKAMAGVINVTLDNNKIRGEVSIPLEKITQKAKGRYLNGTGVFTIQLMDGRLLIFLDALEVKGKPVPEEFMKPLRSENLAKDANTDEKSSAAIAKFESITVQNGQIRIVPKITP
ncbi:MAG: hypothetical protein KKG09_04155 [Verrucomicrobia bacterium]|nr:hypothetical protein [Verrucomicrobiota bacterium]MCG2680451.1 hypothetical protein [Kiritimatiellia bacterium]MBU4247550.1 hypothetical protein [Verrucomicrobiota bacterium]MBU4291262.1 hypothetical protein [Verrucomicrobiota bacterium]MBU4428986.1 hypothetical protein [Verrucomicrobiota bacterium]